MKFPYTIMYCQDFVVRDDKTLAVMVTEEGTEYLVPVVNTHFIKRHHYLAIMTADGGLEGLSMAALEETNPRYYRRGIDQLHGDEGER